MSTVSHGTSLSPWYVTGFMEGEGRFTFLRSGNSLSPIFGVKVPAQNRRLLEEIQEFFGVGSLYEVSVRTPAKSGAYFRVANRDGLQAIVHHFEKFPLRGAKQEGFALWREMVALKSENFRRPPTDRLNQLATQLSATSTRTPKRVSRSRP